MFLNAVINTLIVHRPPSLHKGWHLLISISIHISKGLYQEEVSCFGVKIRVADQRYALAILS